MMMRIFASFLVALLVACATVPSDDRLDVDASLIAESIGVSFYRVVIKNSSDHPLTIERVEVQPTGGTVKPAFVKVREVLSPREVGTFKISTEIDPREAGRELEIGGPTMPGSMRRAGKPTGRVFVTFLDGSERTTASYKVEI